MADKDREAGCRSFHIDAVTEMAEIDYLAWMNCMGNGTKGYGKPDFDGQAEPEKKAVCMTAVLVQEVERLQQHSFSWLAQGRAAKLMKTVAGGRPHAQNRGEDFDCSSEFPKASKTVVSKP